MKPWQKRPTALLMPVCTTFHMRLEHERHEFPDEYSQLAWSVDMGLVESSMVASPLYTPVDWRVVHGE